MQVDGGVWHSVEPDTSIVVAGAGQTEAVRLEIGSLGLQAAPDGCEKTTGAWFAQRINRTW